jgi:hypothetical protein
VSVLLLNHVGDVPIKNSISALGRKLTAGLMDSGKLSYDTGGV